MGSPIGNRPDPITQAIDNGLSSFGKELGGAWNYVKGLVSRSSSPAENVKNLTAGIKASPAQGNAASVPTSIQPHAQGAEQSNPLQTRTPSAEPSTMPTTPPS